jgi:hypothetical protein
MAAGLGGGGKVGKNERQGMKVGDKVERVDGRCIWRGTAIEVRGDQALVQWTEIERSGVTLAVSMSEWEPVAALEVAP